MRARFVMSAFLVLAGCSSNNNSTGSDLAVGGGNDLAVSANDLASAAKDLAGLQDGGNADAFMCTPNAPITCMNGTATACNGTGDGTTQTTCVVPIVGGGTTNSCDGNACAQCSGTGAVCSNNMTCTCANGKLTCTAACAFGCDDKTGKCKDLVPSNQGGSNTKPGDTFTCTGTQDATLAAVTAGAGDTLTFDTTAFTIVKKNGVAVTDFTAMSKWGLKYNPTNGATVSGTSAVVAHIQSLDVTAGANVVITGGNALVLLVDKGVSLAGATVHLEGSLTTTGVPPNTTNVYARGPGAPSLTVAGVGVAPTGKVGGGGSGHGTLGAAGGTDSLGTPGSKAGAAYGDGLLEAGTGGGDGATNGTGGGALQVSACGNVSIDAGVIINASGGGGQGGASGGSSGGVGGASGGHVWLEGATFNTATATATIAGKLAANGGGAGGGSTGNTAGGNGTQWVPTTAVNTPADGGPGGTLNAGKGGSGGVEGTLPTVGGNGIMQNDSGGGGGGAVGRIHIRYSPLASKPTVPQSSPAPVINTATVK